MHEFVKIWRRCDLGVYIRCIQQLEQRNALANEFAQALSQDSILLGRRSRRLGLAQFCDLWHSTSCSSFGMPFRAVGCRRFGVGIRQSCPGCARLQHYFLAGNAHFEALIPVILSETRYC